MAKEAARWKAWTAIEGECGHRRRRVGIDWSTEPRVLPASSCGRKVRGNCGRAGAPINITHVATGRKNWLVPGSPDAGDRAATLLTLISTALRHDLDAWAYLKAAIDQMKADSTDCHSLRPEVWKLAHPQFVRTYRTEERRDAATRTRLTRAQRRLANAKKQSAR